MKTNKSLRSILLFPSFLIMTLSCNPYSTQIEGDNNYINGSFEIVKNNLPVNWHFYSQGKVPNSDFEFFSDDKEYKDGNKSLKFIVRKCESIGGWHSPGFFQDFIAVRNETYKVSFWVINNGCEFKIALQSSEKGKGGPYETVLQTKDTFREWKYFEFYFKTSPAIDMIRFEASILSPGIIWFDDIKIEGENHKVERTL